MTTPSAGDTLAGTQQFVFTRRLGQHHSDIAGPPESVALRGVRHLQRVIGREVAHHAAGRRIFAGIRDLYWTAYWNDATGQQHGYSGHFQVAVDPTSVPLAVDPTVTTGDAPFDAKLTVTTSDPNSQPITLYTLGRR